MTEHQVLINGYLDGELTSSQAASLRRWLRADPRHIDQFVFDCYLHWQTYDEICEERMRENAQAIGDACSSDDTSQESVLAMMLEQEERARARREHQHREQLERERHEAEERFRIFQVLTGRESDGRSAVRHIVIPRALVYAAASAVAAVLVVAAYLMVNATDPNATTVPADIATIGRLTAQVGATWADPQAALGPGDVLDGNARRLTAGVIELTFAQGAKVLIEAPAEFRPRHAHALEVTAGKVTGNVPSQAQGFRVETPTATVVDLGTAFGVTVDDLTRITDVHVFEGSVVVTAAQGGADAKRIIYGGDAQRVDAEGLQSLTFDDRQHLRTLPTDYELAMRRSDPLAYWPLSEAAQVGMARNRGRSGAPSIMPAGAQLTVEAVEGRARPTLLFTRDHDGISAGVIPELNREQSFSLEAWIRPLAGATTDYRLISNRDADGGFSWGLLAEDGGGFRQLRLHIQFPGVREYVSAPITIGGRLSHVAVRIDDAGVPAFYFNGDRVPAFERSDSHELVPVTQATGPFGRSSGRPVYIANDPPAPAEDSANDERPAGAAYRGELDHVAVYDRALTDDEVRMHFRVGAERLRR